MEKARQSNEIDKIINELYENKGYRIYSNGFFQKQEMGGYKLLEWKNKAQIGNAVDELVKRCKYDERTATIWNICQNLKHIKSYNGTFYFYDDETERYILLNKMQVVEYILQEYPFLDINEVERVLDCLKIYSNLNDIPDFNFVEFFSDKETGELLKQKKSKFVFNTTFYQLLHYVLFEERKPYIFTIMSDGGQGKSTAFNFFKHLFSEEFTTDNAKYLNRFSTSAFAGKRMVVFDECTTEFINEMAVLKQATGDDKVPIEEKGKTSYSANIQAFFLFVGNHKINYDILDTGLQRRLINLPWENPVQIKDESLKTYDWSNNREEMLYHIEIARNIEPFNYEKLLTETVKETFTRKSAFYCHTYEEYIDYSKQRGERVQYSKESYCRFWKQCVKLFTPQEYAAKFREREALEEEALKGAEIFKNALKLPPTKGVENVKVSTITEEEIEDIFQYTGGDNEIL